MKKFSGLLGFYNCLKWECNSNIKSFLILDESPVFDVNNEFYFKQHKKQLAINVFKNGQWGSNRSIILEKPSNGKSDYVTGKFTSNGAFEWKQKSLDLHSNQSLINVYCCAVNSISIMKENRRLVNLANKKEAKYKRLQFEFSGLNEHGDRLMGAVNTSNLKSIVYPPITFLFPIPPSWSLNEAATIPSIYITATYSLIHLNRIKKGQSILIHSGSGGVGQAAINIALYYDCNIFITIGSQSKKEFILKAFPKVPANHIGNSRDTSFKSMILKQTKGRGVDVIINSLTDDKLTTSIQCLASGGKLYEIEKYDAFKNKKINFEMFSHNRSFCGIVLDVLSYQRKSDIPIINSVSNIITEGITKGFVKPIYHTVFSYEEVSDVFCIMSKGDYVGKNIIELRRPESNTSSFDCIPRTQFNANKSYIIIGGLGGIGLALTNWLIAKGGRNIIISSRKGPTTGYQRMLLRNWKNTGATVLISTSNAATRSGCLTLLQTAENLGVIDGIFNLALVLKDGAIENLDKYSFEEVLKPKVSVARNFDEITREMYPSLRYFVMFSSFATVVGNGGQTHYGLANSIVERICEDRKTNGFSALAIQWGMVGEVGQVAESDDKLVYEKVGKMGVQTIHSCLKTVGLLLLQNEPVISCRVPKGGESVELKMKTGFKSTIEDVLGITNFDAVSKHVSLVKLGMDSIGSSILQLHLDTKFDLHLSIKSLRAMTLDTLENFITSSTNIKIREKPDQVEDDVPELLSWFGNVDFKNTNINNCFTKLPNLLARDEKGLNIFLLPGADGNKKAFKFFEYRLNAHAFCFEYPYCTENIILEQATIAYPMIKKHTKKDHPFILVGYSFGALVSLELAALFEKEGYFGTVILLDPFLNVPKGTLKEFSFDENFQSFRAVITLGLLKTIFPWKIVSKLLTEALTSNSLERSINTVVTKLQKIEEYAHIFRQKTTYQIIERIYAISRYKRSYEVIHSMVKVISCNNQVSEKILRNNGNLESICKHPVDEFTVEGNHLTILKSPKTIDIINNIIKNLMENTHL